jgi:hypothetical protein
MVFVLGSSSNHIPIKYRCPIKGNSRGTPAYVVLTTRNASSERQSSNTSLTCLTYNATLALHLVPFRSVPGRLRCPPSNAAFRRKAIIPIPNWLPPLGNQAMMRCPTSVWEACNYGFCYKPPSPPTSLVGEKETSSLPT